LLPRQDYLSKCISHLLSVLRHPSERGAAFGAIADMATSLAAVGCAGGFRDCLPAIAAQARDQTLRPLPLWGSCRLRAWPRGTGLGAAVDLHQSTQPWALVIRVGADPTQGGCDWCGLILPLTKFEPPTPTQVRDAVTTRGGPGGALSSSAPKAGAGGGKGGGPVPEALSCVGALSQALQVRGGGCCC
jgi:hypothetical protein